MSAPRIINPATASGGVPVGGSGAAGYLAKWTAATTLGGSTTTGATASPYVDGSGNVGIGTASPTGALHVVGGTAASGNGTSITLAAQSGFGAGVTNGGNIVLTPGAQNGIGGTVGLVDVSGRTGTGIKLPSSPGNEDDQGLDCYKETNVLTTKAVGWVVAAGITTTAGNVNFRIMTTRIGRGMFLHIRVFPDGGQTLAIAPGNITMTNAFLLVPAMTYDTPLAGCSGNTTVTSQPGGYYSSAGRIFYYNNAGYSVAVNQDYIFSGFIPA